MPAVSCLLPPAVFFKGGYGWGEQKEVKMWGNKYAKTKATPGKEKKKSPGQLVPLLNTLNIYGPLLIASNEL